ncbi:MAG TPA: Spy/CpxP family protein refolding chaperone [Terriglobales bacterium]|nr:Spy/CpxP family protein refolding chaperone [Terriglobales bacterium]
MKFSKGKILATVAAVLLVAAGIAVSQTGFGEHGMHHGGFGFEGKMLRMMTHALNLTDAQQAQVKQIIAAEKPNLLPLIQQTTQGRQQIMQQVTSGNFDEAKVRSLAIQQSQTQTELTVERAKIESQIFNILTPDQKTKAVELLQRHEQRMQQHFQNMQQNQQASPQQ